MKASKLRALAAALETPGDLTEEELKAAYEDITEFLLAQADNEEEEEEVEKTFEFTLRIQGSGTSEEDAWDDALVYLENIPLPVYESVREVDFD